MEKGWQVVLTYQNEAIQSKVESLISKTNGNNQILGGFTCDVSSQVEEMPQRLADILQERPLHSVIHSLAHAPNLKSTPLLRASLEDYTKAHEISAYSLISVATATQPLLDDGDSSITALSYLGAVRAIPGYNVMGPAKASLEAIVRGLALEMGPATRVNAVSAGPIATISAKGGISNFAKMQQEMKCRAPLGNVTADQVASTVSFLATEGTGITGQTIYVDGGYSITGGPAGEC
jgi:enoyl-[acyl-carrier protein] reductase I